MGTETHYLLAVNELAKLHLVPAEQKLDTVFKICTMYKESITGWYKKEVRKKRLLSLLLLSAILIIMLIIGSIQTLRLPFAADATEKLQLTQLSLALLTLAVLLFIADRAFRLTAGWINYINTIMAIETRYAEFITEWIKNDATYLTQKNKHYSQAAVIAAAFINTIHLAQQQETHSWSTQLTETIKQLDALINKQQQDKKTGFSTRPGVRTPGVRR